MIEDRSSHWDLKPGDITPESFSWGLTYQGDDGEYLVISVEGLARHLLQSNLGQDLDDLMNNYVDGLTATRVKQMPVELRDELLDDGYDLPV